MFKKTTPRYFIIAIAVLWVIWALWPTLRYSRMSEDQITELRTQGTLADLEQRIISLGLDLKGGIHLVLEVDVPTLIHNLAENRDEAFNKVLEKTALEAQKDELGFFEIFRRNVEADNLRLIRYFSSYGTKVPDIITALTDETNDAVNRALEIIRNRVDQFGVSEPTIQKSGRRRIIVELAGIKDPAQARALIQNTALLEFNILQEITSARDVMLKIDGVLQAAKAPDEAAMATDEPAEGADEAQEVDESLAALLGGEEDTTAAAATGGLTISSENLESNPFTAYIQAAGNDFVVPARYQFAVKQLLAQPAVKAAIPADGTFLWSQRAEPLRGVDADQAFYRLYYVYAEPGLTGGVITEARADIGGLGTNTANQPVVNVTMNDEGSKIWSRLTGANVGRRVAIVLDKKIHMAPVIRNKIPNGRTVIEGMESIDEAKLIAIVLRAGSLPAPVSVIEERTIGPSLGYDSIKKGTAAILIGGVLVILFMLVYYQIAGLIATLALILNLFIVLAVLASLRATLTLPGIAGLILTVGMAVDANVLIFERIREELDKGKTARAAIDSGYGRATVTIVDANVTTIIAALVLWQFGTGPVKGFAVTLFWGILASMFTAIFMTRTIFMSLTQKASTQKLSI